MLTYRNREGENLCADRTCEQQHLYRLRNGGAYLPVLSRALRAPSRCRIVKACPRGMEGSSWWWFKDEEGRWGAG